MSYSELTIALENIIVDKVVTVPTARNEKHDTSAPMDIVMTTKEDGENASQEGDQRIMDLALQAVYKGTGKGKWGFGKGQNWNEKGEKRRQAWRKDPWQKRSGKKGGKGQEKGGKGETRTCWTCGKTGHIAARCRKGGNKNLYAMNEEDTENVEESAVNEEDMHAWCLLEESEKCAVAGGDQQTKQTKSEESQSSVTVERGEQSQFESEEDCGGERQVGERQTHHGLWSRISCDA